METKDKNQLLRTLAFQGNERLVSFEKRNSLRNIVSTLGKLPHEYVCNAISIYQKIIRKNKWYFPDLYDVNLEEFLVRWGNVHKEYFELAEEIFIILSNSNKLEDLVNSSLLDRVIQSETMRGWVGKRSSVGLDALLNNRILQLNELLISLDDDVVDKILTYGGMYINNPDYITAEHEIYNLFETYHIEVGKELTLDMLTNPTAALLLREYCRYSLVDFNEKYHNISTHIDMNRKKFISFDSTSSLFEKYLVSLTEDKQHQVLEILDEIRILNHLNLNLEVKYSFKGWAGLMHVLVFIACSNYVSIDENIYTIRNLLIERGK